MLRLFKQYYPIRNIFFILGEGALIFISVVLTSALSSSRATESGSLVFHAKVFLITFICQLCLYYNEMYNLKAVEGRRELISRLFMALGSAAIILSGIHLWVGNEIINNRAFAVSILLIVILVVSWRFLYTAVLNRQIFDKTVILLGNSGIIKSIIREVSSRKDSGYNIIHVLPDTHKATGHSGVTVNHCTSTYEDLHTISETHGVNLIIADKLHDGCRDSVENELLKCRISGTRIMDGNSFYEMVTGKLHVNQLTPCWLIFSEGFNRSALHHMLKAAFDYTISFILLMFLLPVIGITAILIKLDSKGPVFYSQERVGKNRKPYKMYKFRSMVTDAEKNSGPAWAKAGDSRVTRIGKYLRNFRIDEIPQLWNVLKGDMSFVGPRPEREFFVDQLERSIPYYGIRFTVKPGITGWAQVNYGYGASIEDTVEKLNYDLYYIKNASVFMDLFIVFRTTKTVIVGVENGAGKPIENVC